MSKKVRVGFIVLPIMLALLTVASLITGNYSALTPPEAFKAIAALVTGQDMGLSKTVIGIMLNIRIPRTASALLIGGALAAAGCGFQELFRNSLASPDVLGVSSGACTGAALGIVMGAGAAIIQLLSFSVGVLSVILVFFISGIFKGSRTSNLLISGMLVSRMMNSLLGLIKYTSDQETQLPAIVYWTMGNISSIRLDRLFSVAIPIIISMTVLFAIRWRMNFFAVSESEAVSMGANLRVLRIVVIISATLLVSSSVSVAGNISWIGLVVPHLIKTIFGNNTRWTFPMSVMAGGAFLCGVDILDRLISTSEIPVSILTGLVGIPVFVFCILCNRGIRSNADA